MLNKFLADNRADLIARCIDKVVQRPLRAATKQQLENGIPLFIDQFIRTLDAEQAREAGAGTLISSPPVGQELGLSEMGLSASALGKALLQLGYSVDQVVHDYGDLCQAITDLAFERDIPLSIDEFRALNCCLDHAIADAVTEFSGERDVTLAEQHHAYASEQIGFLMHELRNELGTASMAVTVMESGKLTVASAPAAVLQRSLAAMDRLITRSLDEVRSKCNGSTLHQVFSLASFIAEAKLAADLDAMRLGCTLTVADVDPLLGIDGHEDLLLAALMNLLHNAFKFTRSNTEVLLAAYAQGERILIDVKDHCGGLPLGDAERMFAPFTQRSKNKTGLGLGLSIARKSVEADSGTLHVLDLPSIGCIFTIDLPRHVLQ